MYGYEVTAKAEYSDMEYIYHVAGNSPEQAVNDAYKLHGALYSRRQVAHLLGPQYSVRQV